jgi:RNA polymerase sigma factor (sigma-70 family)
MFSNASTEQGRGARVKALAANLYTEHYSYLLGIATRNAANRADAEEAVQEAFASFIRAFDPCGGAPPLAWLTLTLKRECWARRRGERLDRSAGQEACPDSGEQGFELESIPSGVAGTAERVEFMQDARERLAQLKAAERRALVLIAAGYSYSEVGEISGWSYTKVNRCVAEGRAALRSGGQRAK